MTTLRSALRSLARARVFATLSVASLALTIALNVTAFAVLDSFIHYRGPFPQPERLVRFGIWLNFWASRLMASQDVDEFVRAHQRFVREMPRSITKGSVVATPAGLEDLNVAAVSGDFFPVMQLRPVAGRLFSPHENDVAVVSYRTWVGLLRSAPLDPPLTVSIDGHATTVVGVLPDDMHVPGQADVWKALPPNATFSYPRGISEARGRLVDGAAVEDARMQMETLARELQSRFPGTRAEFRGYAYTHEPPRRALTKSHLALAASAVLILLIACANLANLMVARGIARRGEFALRMAIGASRGDLVRLITTEATLLALGGALLGITWASWGVHLAESVIPPATFLTLGKVDWSWRVVLFGVLVTGITVVLVGLLPALRSSDLSVAEHLKEASPSLAARTGARYSTLAIVQVALALTVLNTAGVLTKSAVMYATRDLGHSVANLYRLNVRGSPNGPRMSTILRDVRRVTGVRFATTDRILPFRTVAGDRDPASVLIATSHQASTDYFRTLDIPVVQGRDFGPDDNNVAIVNETAALALWPGDRAVGRLIEIGSGTWYRVVGVSRNVGDPVEYPSPQVVVAAAVETSRGGPILFRSAANAASVVLGVAREVHATIGSTGWIQVKPLAQDDNLDLVAKQFLAGLFLFLAISAMALAAVGLYSVLAYAVSRRAREFGIRTALGATPRQVFRLVLHDGTVVFLAGTAIGAFAALTMAQLVNALLYRVSFSDVWSLVTAEVVLCAVMVAASWGPAYRAMRSDPLTILRTA